VLRPQSAAGGTHLFTGRVPLLRPYFSAVCPIIVPRNGREADRLTVVYVDSVFVLNALMDYLLVLCAARLAGIPLRRRRYLLAGLLGGLCRGGISAGAGLSLRNAGEAGGRHTAGAGGLWRRGKAAAADAATVRRLLCHGRVRAGPGPGGGGRRADGERRVLHGRGCKGAADRCGRGLSGSDSGVSCGGGKGRPGRAGAGTGVSGRADHGVYRFLRHGKRPAGSGLRSAGAGGVSGAAGRCASKRGPLSAGPRSAGASRRAAGAHDAGGAGAAVPSDPLPRGGSGGRTAAGGAQRLDGGGGGAVCRTAGCLFPHRAGDGIQRPVGRHGWKEKKP